MNVLVFDSETNGLPLYKEPSEHPDQPHIVEIAALLYDADGQLINSFEAIVKPDGWIIAPEVSAIHGITHEIAMDTGIPEKDALEGFLAIHALANMRVAHNCSFDDRIIRIAMKRYMGDEAADLFRAGQSYCTALKSKPILNLPATEAMKKTNFKVKTPNLAEAYRHFTGEDLAGAHRALTDANACARIYFAMQNNANTTAAAEA